MALTRDDIEKIALLSRLKLDESAVEKYTAELDQIVAYVEQLDELDTSDVVPLSHATEIRNALAEDEVQPSMDREKILSNAPKRDDECYRVPAVLG